MAYLWLFIWCTLEGYFLQRLQLIQKHLGSERKKQLIVSVGGVLTVEDVWDRLEKGADLVQVYSALAFEGPFS